jgi:eukaryotic-like serine/threonine-protein kinase
MRLSPGSVLGPYEISGAIGAGGMGEVYRARDSRLGRDVALKVLPHQVTADPDRLARFEREARSSSALNHPNIVTIHDFATAGDDCYLVMELIRGESLRDLISRGPIPQKKLFAIAAGIADGLAAAHAAGIIHRDLKPENVMVTNEGTPKILDFGLVKANPDSDAANSPTEVRVTSAGVILGTVTYMSPEQARGQSVALQSDQFALGLMLYEMATATHPFKRASPYETVTAILHEDTPPLGDSFPEPFVWIVERCLAKDPAERYASTIDLAHDLAALRDRVGSGRSRARSTDTPKRKITLARAALLAAAAALAAVALFALGPAMTQRQPAGIVDPIQVHIATPNFEPHLGEVAVPVTISPDGRYLVTYAVGSNGTNELWLSDLRSGTQRLVAENAFGAAWSDDSRAIAFFANGKLNTIPVDGGPARVICDANPEGTPSWQGDTILFVQYSGGPERIGIYSVSAQGGTAKHIVTISTSSPGSPSLSWWPQFLPDGKRFLYMTLLMPPGSNQILHEVMIGSLDGSAPKKIGDIDSRAVYADGHLLYVRDGTLLAQPLDIEKAQFKGESKPLVDGLHYFRSTGMAAFSVSRNGILVWRSARRPSRLVWLDRNGTELESIATALFDVPGRLSRDGNRYAAGVIDAKQGISDVWVYDLDRGSSERLTFDLLDQKAPVWAADGSTIFYRSDGQGGPPDIVAFRPGEPLPEIVHSGPSVEHPEDVSADGRWLLFSTPAGIFALPFDPPGDPRPVVATPFNENSPRFSPDGTWVAYSSNLSGRFEIYVKPFEGSGAATRISRDGGTTPRWSSDGRELFFFGPAGRVMSVPFDGSFGTPQMLFQNTSAISFESAPDGRFLIHLDERISDPTIHLLLNWTERLRQ